MDSDPSQQGGVSPSSSAEELAQINEPTEKDSAAGGSGQGSGQDQSDGGNMAPPHHIHKPEPKTPPQNNTKKIKGGPVPWLVARSALWFLGASVAKSLGATWLAFGVAPWPHSSPLARVFAASSSARPRRVQHTKADTSLHLSLFHLHLHCRTALPCFTCTAPTCLSCPFLHCPVCCLLLHC